METIITILMKRDGLSYDRARIIYEDTKSEIFDAINGTSCLTPEEVLLGIGLELDYVFYFI